MTIKRLDHVSVVVDDLAAAIDFFSTLGMTREAEMPVEGLWVDRVNGIAGVQVDIVMMLTPDGHGRLELTRFRNPKLVNLEPPIAPPNALGLRSIMFAVESVDDTVARLRANGAELIGEVAQYEDKYRLLLYAGPCRHHRRAGRGTLLTRCRPSENGSRLSAPWSCLARLDVLTGEDRGDHQIGRLVGELIDAVDAPVGAVRRGVAAGAQPPLLRPVDVVVGDEFADDDGEADGEASA